MILTTNLSNNSYDIVIEKGALNRLDSFIDLHRRVLIVTDDGVPCEYAQAVRKFCLHPVIHTLKQGEESKSFSNLEALCHIMLETKRNVDKLTNSNDLAGIFNAFCEKGVYKSENVPADFTNRNDGELIALFGGHGHVRWSGYMGNLPFLQIQTPSNMMHMPQNEPSWIANLPAGWESVDREMNTLSEDLWDTVIYNIKENKIYSYSVIPYYFCENKRYYGKEIYLEKIKSPTKNIADDWWNEQLN